jgi:hypothetical protein
LLPALGDHRDISQLSLIRRYPSYCVANHLSRVNTRYEPQAARQFDDLGEVLYTPRRCIDRLLDRHDWR